MLRGVPARDRYHQHVVDALVREGWRITHDPLSVRVGAKDIFIDLGAERFLGAEKGGRKIAVEIKSFIGSSEVRELEVTLGQFVLYGDALAGVEPDRTLYVAVRAEVYTDLFEEPIGVMLLQNGRLRLLVFDPDRREVVRWIP
jgi:XisH protein